MGWPIVPTVPVVSIVRIVPVVSIMPVVPVVSIMPVVPVVSVVPIVPVVRSSRRAARGLGLGRQRGSHARARHAIEGNSPPPAE
jgi:hypothetical protein